MNEIDDYLRANRDAFTRDALTRRLVESGRDPAEVEAAWSRVGLGPLAGGMPGSVPAATPTGKAGIGTRLLVVAAILVYGGAIALAGIAISRGGAISILMIVYIIAMLFGLVHSVRRLLAAPTRGNGVGPIWWSVGLAFIIFVGLSGACFVALGPVTTLTGGGIL